MNAPRQSSGSAARWASIGAMICACSAAAPGSTPSSAGSQAMASVTTLGVPGGQRPARRTPPELKPSTVAGAAASAAQQVGGVIGVPGDAAGGPSVAAAAAGAAAVVPDHPPAAGGEGLGLRGEHLHVLGRPVDQQQRGAVRPRCGTCSVRHRPSLSA